MSDPRIGTELAGYRIEALIGSGGMGDRLPGRAFPASAQGRAQILAPELARDPSFRARFERESRLAASLEHPNIVPVYDAGEVDDVAYIAMRYVDGPDLGSVLEEEGRLEPTRTASIIAQVAAALDAAHAHGLIHRDVKPATSCSRGSTRTWRTSVSPRASARRRLSRRPGAS